MEKKVWDTHFGPDPLEGRVRKVGKENVSEPPAQTYYTTPGKYLNPIPVAHLAKQPQIAIKLQQYMVQLQTTIQFVSLPHGCYPRSDGPRSDIYCTYCKSSGEDKRVYLNHTTNNCWILQNCICGCCGQKGHTM